MDRILGYGDHLWVFPKIQSLEMARYLTRIYLHYSKCPCGNRLGYGYIRNKDAERIWRQHLSQVEDLYKKNGQFAELDPLEFAAKLGFGEILDE